MAVIISGAQGFWSTRISRFPATAISNSHGLMEGDQIVRVNNKRINVYNDLAYALIREGANPVRITVIRSGERVVVEDVRFPVESEEGLTFGTVDFFTEIDARTPLMVVRQTFFQSLSTIDMVWSSFFDLITGRFGMEAISGPVGVTQIIGDSAREAVTAEGRAGSRNFMFLLAVITINLGVMNLLPIPALDGGRIVFLVIELIRRKPVNPEHEGYVHLAGLALMFILMIVVTYQDIVQLIVR
jgi:regulator of sigma E protease